MSRNKRKLSKKSQNTVKMGPWWRPSLQKRKTTLKDPLQQPFQKLKHTNYAGLQGHLPHGEFASTVASSASAEQKGRSI